MSGCTRVVCGCIIDFMKIYFTASLRGKKEFGESYVQIVKELALLGNKVFADHVLNNDFSNVVAETKSDAQKSYHKLLGDIKKSDVVVAEVSAQSLSVGHELTEAMTLNKPLVVLYTGKNRPGLLFGSMYDKMQIIQYDKDDLRNKLIKAIEEAMKHADVRFNFFVSPKILNYLDWVAQKRMIPRSVFLRNLIEREMKKDKDFK